MGLYGSDTHLVLHEMFEKGATNVFFLNQAAHTKILLFISQNLQNISLIQTFPVLSNK